MNAWIKSKSELQELGFTHKGWFCGIVPVYIGDPNGTCLLMTRNLVPEFVLDCVSFIFEFVADTIMYDGGWPIKISGEL